MTYDEKQKLTANLQSLPLEKLVDIVLIFKKRNPTLSQHDDEIELDLDSVDAETLWQLDRFALNFKKKENKEKRKAEIALQPGFEATPPVLAISPAVTLLEHSKIGGNSDAIPAPDQGKCEGDGVSRSNGPSSSSSDSGSSSSDSDSDNSSSNGSEGGGSPKT